MITKDTVAALLRNIKISREIRIRRMSILIVVVSVCLITTLSVTYAFFIKNDQVANILKSPDLGFSFVVDEVFTEQITTTPGQRVEKVVDVRNTGDETGFVRTLVLAEITAKDGTILEAVPGVTFTFDGLNTTDWTTATKKWADGDDGYYYYLDKLEAGKKTEQPLFVGVTLAADLPEQYKDATLKIEIKVEASETIRAKYRNGFWGCGDNTPASQALARIDDVLKALAK
jgi:hypothetical protein